MATAMRPRHWLLGWDEASTAIDTAFSMLLLVVFIIGIFEFAFGYWVLNSMQLSVEQGGRYAIAHRICPVTGSIGGISCTSGACRDPTDSSQVNPTVQQVVLSGLPGGGLFSAGGITAVCRNPDGTIGNCCPATPVAGSKCPTPGADPSCPQTLSVSVSYANSFLNALFPYGMGSANNVPMD